MYYPSQKEFLKLAKKGNIIPVYKEILADLETPVSAYLKIGDNRYSFLLESVEEQEKIGRFSFLATNPVFVFQSKARNIKIIKKGKVYKTFQIRDNPIQELRKIMRSFKFVKITGLPRFCGGLVGYIGYDCIRFFEELPEVSKDDLNLPDCVFMLAKDLLIFDHILKKIKLLSCAYIKKNASKAYLRKAYRDCVKKINNLKERLEYKLSLPEKEMKETSLKSLRPHSNLSKRAFKNMVKKAKRYIRQGEIIQVVLSQRFSLKLKNEPFSVYRNLRSINPSPYMFFIKFDTFYLIGSSPEMLVRLEAGKVQTRPIAGTRPRGVNDIDDERLKKELLRDSKERCEHTMLVDLGRNDLGRVCKFNSVNLKEFMKIEFYSHVMHIVSSIEGRLKKTADIFDLLIAAFPAGTVSGAPKVRAMEIIEELEKTRRGPYAGCVGYFDFSGNMDTCITIRTILIYKNKAYVQAGAGIVADSKPEREYIETFNKAKAMLEAIRR